MWILWRRGGCTFVYWLVIIQIWSYSYCQISNFRFRPKAVLCESFISFRGQTTRRNLLILAGSDSKSSIFQNRWKCFPRGGGWLSEQKRYKQEGQQSNFLRSSLYLWNNNLMCNMRPGAVSLMWGFIIDSARMLIVQKTSFKHSQLGRQR